MGTLRVMVVLMGLACDDTKPPEPGQACDTADNMVCGKTASGTTVAMVCMSSIANGGASWSYQTNCSTCDHVAGCSTEVICNGTNVANEGQRCEVEGVGACNISNNAHLLKCEGGTWTMIFDCSTTGMTCGFVAGGSLSCK